MPECWFSKLPGAGPCDGALVKCHLVTKQELKNRWRSIHHGTALDHGRREAAVRDLPSTLLKLYADARTWVWGCGGPIGNGGHHAQFKPDGPRLIDRHRLPEGVEEIARLLQLEWWLDRTYGERGFTPGEDGFSTTVDGAAGHAAGMHRRLLGGGYE